MTGGSPETMPQGPDTGGDSIQVPSPPSRELLLSSCLQGQQRRRVGTSLDIPLYISRSASSNIGEHALPSQAVDSNRHRTRSYGRVLEEHLSQHDPTRKQQMYSFSCQQLRCGHGSRDCSRSRCGSPRGSADGSSAVSDGTHDRACRVVVNGTASSLPQSDNALCWKPPEPRRWRKIVCQAHEPPDESESRGDDPDSRVGSSHYRSRVSPLHLSFVPSSEVLASTEERTAPPPVRGVLGDGDEAASSAGVSTHPADSGKFAVVPDLHHIFNTSAGERGASTPVSETHHGDGKSLIHKEDFTSVSHCGGIGGDQKIVEEENGDELFTGDESAGGDRALVLVSQPLPSWDPASGPVLKTSSSEANCLHRSPPLPPPRDAVIPSTPRARSCGFGSEASNRGGTGMDQKPEVLQESWLTNSSSDGWLGTQEESAPDTGVTKALTFTCRHDGTSIVCFGRGDSDSEEKSDGDAGEGGAAPKLFRREAALREKPGVCHRIWDFVQRLVEPIFMDDVDYVTMQQCASVASRHAREDCGESRIDDASSWASTPTGWSFIDAPPMPRRRMFVGLPLWGSPGGQSRRRGPTAQRRLQAMSKPLNPRSLLFLDQQFEEEFAFNVNRFCANRMVFTAWTFLIITIFNYACFVCGQRTGWYVQGTFCSIIVHSFMALALASCLALWWAWRCCWHCVKGHAEQVLYWFITVLNFIVTSFAICLKLYIFYIQEIPIHSCDTNRQRHGRLARPVEIPDTPGSDRLVYLLLNENAIDSFLSSYFFLMILFFNHVIPGRLGITVWHQLAILLLHCVPFVMGLKGVSAVFWPQLIRVVTTMVFFLASLATNVCTEIRRRDSFCKWLILQRAAEAERRNRMKSKKKKVVSGLDRVQANCKEACTVLERCKQHTVDVEFSAQLTLAIDLIHQSIELLTRCPNIYTTHMDKDLRMQSYIQGYQIEAPALGTRGLSLHLHPGTDNLTSLAQSVSTMRTFVDGASCTRGLGPTRSSSPAHLPVPRHASKVWAALKDGVSSLSLLELAAQTDNRALVEVGYALLKPLVTELGCEDIVLRNFLWRVEQNYKDNPYHNASHGAMVAFMMAQMLNALKVFTESQVLALTGARVAALCHDVGHPGRNNVFLINSSHLASIVYNDSSILENYHAALAFRILSSPGCNLLEKTSPEVYRSVRGLMIDLILATDMKSHFDFLTRIKNRKNAPEFNVQKNVEDQYLVTEGCIRAADISHGMVRWEEHFEWSMRVTLEFFLQGDEEKRLGLPVSPLCDRDQAGQLHNSQAGFLTYVVMPLLVELQFVDEPNPFMSSLLTSLKSNISAWESMEGKEVEMPSSFLEFERRLRGKDMVLDVTVLTCDEQSLFAYPALPSSTVAQLREETEDNSEDELHPGAHRPHATPARRTSREEVSLPRRFMAELSKAPRPAGIHKGDAVTGVVAPPTADAVTADNTSGEVAFPVSSDKNLGNGAVT